jgi:hypothetical protein
MEKISNYKVWIFKNLWFFYVFILSQTMNMKQDEAHCIEV